MLNNSKQPPRLSRVSPISPERDRDRKLLCNNCNKWHAIETSWADLNGPAFRAFYCSPCVREGKVSC
jgi:hypothetical protein